MRGGTAGVLPRAAAAALCRTRGVLTRGVLAEGDLGSGALSPAVSLAISARDACSKPTTGPAPRCDPWVAGLGGGGGTAMSGVGVCFML